MSHYILSQVKVIQPESKFHGQTVDIEIQNGTIKAVASKIEGAERIELKGTAVSTGWLDLRAHFEDPGNEIREDLLSGLKAAAKGGFTHVAINPATTPPIDNKASVEYIARKSALAGVTALPIGTITEGRKGENIGELYDMHTAGAVAFSDDQQTIDNPSILLRALQYTVPFKGKVMQFAMDRNLAGSGTVNEGPVATYLGLKGIPDLAETTVLQRDIEIANYVGAGIHFQAISTAKGCEILSEARKENKKITADVTAQHLIFSDEAIKQFDPNYKVLPPLGTETDRQGLIQAIKNGTIGVICSDHRPIDVEHKDVDFQQATPGVIAVQTLFPALNAALGDELGIDVIIEKLTTGPRAVLDLELPLIEAGHAADLTLFEESEEWTLTTNDLRSKSKNSPYIGQNMKGRVKGIVNGPHFEIFE